MKLTINYDLINAISNANEPFNTFKIVRNRKKQWALINLPMYAIIDTIVQKNLFLVMGTLFIQFGLLVSNDYFLKNSLGIDIYKEKSIKDLKQLVIDLEQYLKTDYDLLLQSKLYDRKYKININKKEIFNIMEQKYILVPTYDINNNIRNTSILQEHIIGTNDYVLSIGSPQKQLQNVYSSI